MDQQAQILNRKCNVILEVSVRIKKTVRIKTQTGTLKHSDGERVKLTAEKG